jgi:hypothetical protein
MVSFFGQKKSVRSVIWLDLPTSAKSLFRVFFFSVVSFQNTSLERAYHGMDEWCESTLSAPHLDMASFGASVVASLPESLSSNGVYIHVHIYNYIYMCTWHYTCTYIIITYHMMDVYTLYLDLDEPSSFSDRHGWKSPIRRQICASQSASFSARPLLVTSCVAGHRGLECPSTTCWLVSIYHLSYLWMKTSIFVDHCFKKIGNPGQSLKKEQHHGDPWKFPWFIPYIYIYIIIYIP